MAIDLVHFHNPTYKVRDVKGGEETERGGDWEGRRKGEREVITLLRFPAPGSRGARIVTVTDTVDLRTIEQPWWTWWGVGEERVQGPPFMDPRSYQVAQWQQQHQQKLSKCYQAKLRQVLETLDLHTFWSRKLTIIRLAGPIDMTWSTGRHLCKNDRGNRPCLQCLPHPKLYKLMKEIH